VLCFKNGGKLIVNSEELELSLRTEFENYLKNALAEMKQEVSDFQEKFESELDQHKANLDNVFKEFSEKMKADQKLEDSFKETVTEHLKLARDEGARITATAIAEAEKIEEEQALAENISFSDLRDAIDEISSKDTQSEILKSLVNYAAEYTPRGAFFIVKNEHLVGWRVFGKEEQANPQSVREVFFPVASKTALGESIKTLAKIESSYGVYDDDSIYLNQLDFGHPENMYSIPLVARGRGVAVLYADAGTEGGTVNSEALETLVRVAGLTVEVLASSKNAKNQEQEEEEAEIQSDVPETKNVSDYRSETQSGYQPEIAKVEAPESYSFTDTAVSIEEEPPAVVEEESYSYQPDYQPEPVAEVSSPVEEVQEDYFAPGNEAVEEVEEQDQSSGGFDYQSVEPVATEETPVAGNSQTDYGEYSWDQSSEPVEEVQETNQFTSPYEEVLDDSTPSVEEFQTELSPTYEADSSVGFSEDSQAEDNQFEYQSKDESTGYEVEAPVTDEYVENDYSAVEETTSFDTGYESPEEFSEPVEESVVEEAEEETVEMEAPAPPAPKPRFGDRNVDLPIEVTEDERRLHNDARRFARLLVSEIKLYNEQKVKEGRESADLYERLREAIDRSREMYDKRVQPPVAAKFDYFHYELVNTLAEGEEPKLGGSYPGANV
jgi:hypothetical protein